LVSPGPAILNLEILADRPTHLLQPLQECRVALLHLRIGGVVRHEYAHAPHPPGLLCARRERPSCRCTGEQCDELAPPHGAYPKARDHGLSIAGQARASHQKRATHVRSVRRTTALTLEADLA